MPKKIQMFDVALFCRVTKDMNASIERRLVEERKKHPDERRNKADVVRELLALGLEKVE